MEAVHVELPDEAVDLVVSEVSRKHDLLEFVDVFDDELDARGGPVCDLIELFVLPKIMDTFNISKVLAMKPATSAVSVYSISWEDIADDSI